MQKTNIISGIISIFLTIFFTWICFNFLHTTTNEITIKEFTTDVCTGLPSTSFDECCIAHDRAYWKGGSAKQRLQADVEFKECVERKTQSPVTAEIVYTAVRVGGTPFLPTPWRWGYGWNFGRGYTPPPNK